MSRQISHEAWDIQRAGEHEDKKLRGRIRGEEFYHFVVVDPADRADHGVDGDGRRTVEKSGLVLGQKYVGGPADRVSGPH